SLQLYPAPFVFCLCRLPPSPRLFPYTTLFRSLYEVVALACRGPSRGPCYAEWRMVVESVNSNTISYFFSADSASLRFQSFGLVSTGGLSAPPTSFVDLPLLLRVAAGLGEELWGRRSNSGNSSLRS